MPCQLRSLKPSKLRKQAYLSNLKGDSKIASIFLTSQINIEITSFKINHYRETLEDPQSPQTKKQVFLIALKPIAEPHLPAISPTLTQI